MRVPVKFAGKNVSDMLMQKMHEMRNSAASGPAHSLQHRQAGYIDEMDPQISAFRSNRMLSGMRQTFAR